MRRVIGLTTAAIVVAFMLIEPPGGRLVAPAPDPETFRLVHAIGANERVSAKGMSKEECHKRREELRDAAAGLGAGGSITCLPDSIFE